MKKITIRTDRPISFSFAGGGSHGAHEAGAFQAIDEQMSARYGTHFIGTSTGSLIAGPAAATAATGDTRYVTDMINIYRHVLTGNILQPRDALAHSIGGVKGLLLSSMLQQRDSLFDISPLVKLTEEIMDVRAWKAIMKAANQGRLDLGFCCVNMQTGLAEVFWASERSRAEMKAAMVASAAQPVIMSAQEIDGVQYCDGGLTDANPARHLFPKIKGDHTIICFTPDKRKPLPTKEATFPGVLDQLERTLAIFVNNVYQQNIDQVEALRLASQYDIDVHWIEPSRRIKFDALSFEQPAMKKAVDQGWADVQKNVVILPPPPKYEYNRP